MLWHWVEASTDWVEAQVVVPALGHDAADVKFGAQVRAHLLAGTCLGLGFRFVGSASRAARDVLLHHLRLALPNSVEASCAGTALALVMAGTGDLESLKALRGLAPSSFGGLQLKAQALGLL